MLLVHVLISMLILLVMLAPTPVLDKPMGDIRYNDSAPVLQVTQQASEYG